MVLINYFFVISPHISPRYFYEYILQKLFLQNTGFQGTEMPKLIN